MGIASHQDNGSGVIGTEQPGQFCLATTRAGKRCRAIPLADHYCFAHSPTLAEKRKAAQQAGGRAISERRRLLVGIVSFDTPEGVRQFFEGLARAVLRGEVPAAKALAASQIGEAALRVKAGIELGERLDSLESRIQSLVERRFTPGAGVTA
jgi:hypothetical protein